MRNALTHAPAKQRVAVPAMLKTIFLRESKAQAVAQWDVVAFAGLTRPHGGHAPHSPLREKQLKLVALIDGPGEDVLAYMDFPGEHWPQIAATNPLERVNKETKRRSDVVDVFPNDDAIVRLVGALMLEINGECAVARRYMGLESLALITDAPNCGLPAGAA